MGLGPIYTAPSSGGLASAGLPAVVYVSPSGDDTTGERGNQGKPFQTIAQALAASSAGDVIELAPGTYTENVAWTERRSLRGAGSRESFIVGTFTLTAPANNSAQNINIQDVNISGAGALNFAAKTGGDVLVEIRDCIFQSSWTHSRAVAGAYTLAIYNTRQIGGTLTANFDNVILEGSEIAAFTFNASAGSEQVRITACRIPTLALNGAGSKFEVAGCICTSAFTWTDAFGGGCYTTGCNFAGATLSISNNGWRDEGSAQPYISPAQLTADQTDYTGARNGDRVRLSSDASRYINSLAGQTSGRRQTLTNVGANTINLLLDDGATGTAAMRFAAVGGFTEVRIPANGSVTVEYDGTSARWRVIAMANAVYG